MALSIDRRGLDALSDAIGRSTGDPGGPPAAPSPAPSPSRATTASAVRTGRRGGVTTSIDILRERESEREKNGYRPNLGKAAMDATPRRTAMAASAVGPVAAVPKSPGGTGGVLTEPVVLRINADQEKVAYSAARPCAATSAQG